MSTNTDDVDDEYLDDPISLMAIEDIKTEICDEDQIFDVSSDEEDTYYTSAYGKKSFVLPVTFFDISRNVRLLNKCKPLSITIVDCKQHPTYYTKYREKCTNEPDDSCVQNKCKSLSDVNLSNVYAEDGAIINSTKDNKNKEGEKKRRVHKSDSFYEKLKQRKEERKRIALNCKDLSQVDFKRNMGLVGLKITDTIFKQIIDSEKALINTKCSSVENKHKEKNQNNPENPSFVTQTVTSEQKSLNMKNCTSFEYKCSKKLKKDVCDSEKALLFATKTQTTEDKLSENFDSFIEPLLSSCMKNKSFVKNPSDTEKAITESKKNYTDKNKKTCTDKIRQSIAEKESIETMIKHSETKCKEKKSRDKAFVKKYCNSTKYKPKKEEVQSNKYMKKVGAALDNLGTSMIPLADNVTDCSRTKNDRAQDDLENKLHMSQNDVKEKLGNNIECSQTRCSLKISSREDIKKALKRKHVKPESKTVISVVSQQTSKDAYPKVDKIGTILNLERSKHNFEGRCIISGPKQSKSGSSKEAYHSDEPKRLDTAAVIYSSRDQAGPNSPVIPCTTVTVRATQPKLTQNIPSAKVASVTEKLDNAAFSFIAQTNSQKSSSQNVSKPKSTSIVQKQSNHPKDSTTNQPDLRNSNYTATSKQNESAIPKANIKTNSDTKSKFGCNQTTTPIIKTLKFTEFQYPRSQKLAAFSGYALSDQNLSKTHPIKEADLVHTAIKPATSAENSANVPANLNQPTNMPPTTQTPSKFFGHNAIILRKPPLAPSRSLHNNPNPSQGQPIQTLVNSTFQYQSIPPGPRPMRFHHPPPYPPPPPPPASSNNHPNLTHIRPQRYIPPNRMPRTYIRGMDMGINQWRFYNPPFPSVYRPPLIVPKPLSPQINKDSYIGNTANGDPIKKINITVVSNTVEDKQKMLAELNNAIMSPELGTNEDDNSSKDLKRKAGAGTLDLVIPKYSKPGPLSRKPNITTDLNKVKIPDKLSPKTGYSPPILPIFTYQESFKIFTPKDTKKSNHDMDTQNHTPLKRPTSTASFGKLEKDYERREYKKRIPHKESEKQDKGKKISFDDYRKRVVKDDVDRIDVYKMRKHECKNVAEDYNQDQGYDSDSTVKL